MYPCCALCLPLCALALSVNQRRYMHWRGVHPGDTALCYLPWSQLALVGDALCALLVVYARTSGASARLSPAVRSATDVNWRWQTLHCLELYVCTCLFWRAGEHVYSVAYRGSALFPCCCGLSIVHLSDAARASLGRRKRRRRCTARCCVALTACLQSLVHVLGVLR
jgi:hypothetical protein